VQCKVYRYMCYNVDVCILWRCMKYVIFIVNNIVIDIDISIITIIITFCFVL
jgi:hypothetical protein